MDAQADFLKLHMAHQKALFGYLLAAVHDFQQAEDLLQQVTLILWKKFDTYRPDSPFLSWAFGVARRELSHHFRKSGREAVMPLEMLDSVAGALVEEEDRLAGEGAMLASCVQKLSDDQRRLLKLRYEEGFSLQSVAGKLGQNLAAVNMKLVRIRRALLNCVEQAHG